MRIKEQIQAAYRVIEALTNPQHYRQGILTTWPLAVVSKLPALKDSPDDIDKLDTLRYYIDNIISDFKNLPKGALLESINPIISQAKTFSEGLYEFKKEELDRITAEKQEEERQRQEEGQLRSELKKIRADDLEEQALRKELDDIERISYEITQKKQGHLTKEFKNRAFQVEDRLDDLKETSGKRKQRATEIDRRLKQIENQQKAKEQEEGRLRQEEEARLQEQFRQKELEKQEQQRIAQERWRQQQQQAEIEKQQRQERMRKVAEEAEIKKQQRAAEENIKRQQEQEELARIKQQEAEEESIRQEKEAERLRLEQQRIFKEQQEQLRRAKEHEYQQFLMQEENKKLIEKQRLQEQQEKLREDQEKKERLQQEVRRREEEAEVAAEKKRLQDIKDIESQYQLSISASPAQGLDPSLTISQGQQNQPIGGQSSPGLQTVQQNLNPDTGGTDMNYSKRNTELYFKMAALVNYELFKKGVPESLMEIFRNAQKVHNDPEIDPKDKFDVLFKKFNDIRQHINNLLKTKPDNFKNDGMDIEKKIEESDDLYERIQKDLSAPKKEEEEKDYQEETREVDQETAKRERETDNAVESALGIQRPLSSPTQRQEDLTRRPRLEPGMFAPISQPTQPPVQIEKEKPEQEIQQFGDFLERVINTQNKPQEKTALNDILDKMGVSKEKRKPLENIYHTTPSMTANELTKSNISQSAHTEEYLRDYPYSKPKDYSEELKKIAKKYGAKLGNDFEMIKGLASKIEKDSEGQTDKAFDAKREERRKAKTTAYLESLLQRKIDPEKTVDENLYEHRDKEEQRLHNKKLKQVEKAIRNAHSLRTRAVPYSHDVEFAVNKAKDKLDKRFEREQGLSKERRGIDIGNLLHNIDQYETDLLFKKRMSKKQDFADLLELEKIKYGRLGDVYDKERSLLRDAINEQQKIQDYKDNKKEFKETPAIRAAALGSNYLSSNPQVINPPGRQHRDRIPQTSQSIQNLLDGLAISNNFLSSAHKKGDMVKKRCRKANGDLLQQAVSNAELNRIDPIQSLKNIAFNPANMCRYGRLPSPPLSNFKSGGVIHDPILQGAEKALSLEAIRNDIYKRLNAEEAVNDYSPPSTSEKINRLVSTITASSPMTAPFSEAMYRNAESGRQEREMVAENRKRTREYKRDLTNTLLAALEAERTSSSQDKYKDRDFDFQRKVFDYNIGKDKQDQNLQAAKIQALMLQAEENKRIKAEQRAFDRNIKEQEISLKNKEFLRKLEKDKGFLGKAFDWLSSGKEKPTKNDKTNSILSILDKVDNKRDGGLLRDIPFLV